MDLNNIRQVGRATFIPFDEQIGTVDDILTDTEAERSKEKNEVVMNHVAQLTASEYTSGELRLSEVVGNLGRFSEGRHMAEVPLYHTQWIGLADNEGEVIKGNPLETLSDASGLLVQGALRVYHGDRESWPMVTLFAEADKQYHTAINQAYEIVTDALIRGETVQAVMERPHTGTSLRLADHTPRMDMYVSNPTMDRVSEAATGFNTFANYLRDTNVASKITNTAGLVYTALQIISAHDTLSGHRKMDTEAMDTIHDATIPLLRGANSLIEEIDNPATSLANYLA